MLMSTMNEQKKAFGWWLGGGEGREVVREHKINDAEIKKEEITQKRRGNMNGTADNRKTPLICYKISFSAHQQMFSSAFIPFSFSLFHHLLLLLLLSACHTQLGIVCE